MVSNMYMCAISVLLNSLKLVNSLIYVAKLLQCDSVVRNDLTDVEVIIHAPNKMCSITIEYIRN